MTYKLDLKDKKILNQLDLNCRQSDKEIGKKIGETCDLAIITTKEYFEDIKEGAISAKMKEDNILMISDPGSILEKIDGFSEEEDIILLESRVPKKILNSLEVK